MGGVMAFLAAIPAWVPALFTVGATIFSAVQQKRAGDEAGEAAEDQAAAALLNSQRQAEASRFEAAQLEQIAGEERAVAQRRAGEERRRGRILESRALALAAAGGGGATDPTVVNIISDLAGEGEYAAAVRIYEGEEAARRARMGARAQEFEADTALQAGAMTASGLRAEGSARRSAGTSGAVSTLFSGAGRAMGIYGRYGTIDSPTPGIYPYDVARPDLFRYR